MPVAQLLLTAKQFRNYARNNGYRGYSRLKKEDLRELISKPPEDYKAKDEEKNEERRQRGDYTEILAGTVLDEFYDFMTGEILQNLFAFINNGSDWVFEIIEFLNIYMTKYQPMQGGLYKPKGTDKDTKYNHAIDPLVKSDHPDRPHRVDLLMIKGKNSKDEETSHYTVVKDMGRLLRKITTKKKVKHYHCRNCYKGYICIERLRVHEDLCHTHEPTRIEMPKATKDGDPPTQYFKNFFKSQKVPFTIYADFESLTVPFQSCEPEVPRKTTKYQKHEPSGFCYYIKCFDDSVYSHEPVVYTKQSETEDVSQVFVNMLEEDVRKIHDRFWKRENNPYILAENMIISPEERKLYKKSTRCHICKKLLTPKNKNNRTVRDHCHFTGKFRGAAHNQCNLFYRMPSFIPVFFHNLAGYDSHLFIKNLGKTKGKIDCIPNNEERYISFSKKMVVDSFVPYRDRINARPNEVCHICEEPLTPKDKKNPTVADVSYPKKESLGPAHQKCIKPVDVKYEIRFLDSFKFQPAGLEQEGGICLIPTRHSKANNKYMGDDYDPSKPSKYIEYVDANNLYGWAMSKPLPVGDFKWMSSKELDNWRKIPCTLEVNLEYPKELHDLHNDFPLAPERLIVNKVEKLIPNLNDKEKYVIHHVALKQCLELGLKLTKVHRGIKYREEAFMKSYIDKNTSLRTKAKSEFEKDFFKLMNNSVFGKTMENIRNRVDIHLVTTQDEARKLTTKPTYDRYTSFDENLVAVHMKKTSLYFNKPIYLGASILDIAKTKMYDFHYNYIKKKYGNKAKLCMTDTDSLLYQIETEDFYEDITPDVDRYFDTSNYPADHPSGIPTGKNKKVPGMFKDEAGGKQIVEYVGLRPKLYAFRMHEGNEEKRCKGIKKAVVEKSMNFDNFKQCLTTKKPLTRNMNVMRSHNHEIYTETVNKVALDANDDKRVILEDGIHTYAIGHYAVKLE
ncbi:uncharacterized protein [Amphiura filiformis]|uniref:uncharacterized protein n=1 Tax=Amphiura filiformis TaxID=82378 RepID=UPI003B21CA8D